VLKNLTRRAPLPGRSLKLPAGVLLAAALLGMPLATPPVAQAAVSNVKVAIIVGPAGSHTGSNRALGDATAAEAANYTSNVVKVYSPHATWKNVRAAMTGASIVVYIGLGYGYPGSGTSSLSTVHEDGMALNGYTRASNYRWVYYGERYMRTAALASNAVVLLNRLNYASGNSPAGRSQPSVSGARQRADNYAAGFLAAGASVVVAEYQHSVISYIRRIFTQDHSMLYLFQSVGWYHHHIISFRSNRTSGALGRLDPLRSRSYYYRSIVGRNLLVSTSAVRGGAPVSTPPAAPTNQVPSSINATCSSNVSSALNSWIKSQPDGATLVFPSGSCYELGGDAGINLSGRTGLTLQGAGSTLRLRTNGASNLSSAFFLQASSHITIKGFTVDGGNTATGTTGAKSAINEHKNGAVVRAKSAYVTFSGVTWDRLYGFGVLISDEGGAGSWPHDITVTGSTIRGGEMGVGILAGENITVTGSTINDTVYTAFDLEPDQPQQGFRNVVISNNSITRYSWGQTLTSWFVAACPNDSVVSSVVASGLTITGNNVHIGAATSNNGNFDGLGGLGIRADKANQKYNFVITDNTTADNDTQSKRDVMYFDHVSNLRITGNRQPIAGTSALVSALHTAGTVVISGNNTAP
jgi:hypothetical protein